MGRMNGIQRAAAERKRTGAIKSTPRQREAARIRANNPTMSEKDVLIAAGYDESTALAPSIVTGSLGYRAELAKYGLTEELITTALVEDIQQKPQKRVRELELGAKILRMVKNDDNERPNVNIALFSSEQQEKIAARILQRLDNNPPQSHENA